MTLIEQLSRWEHQSDNENLTDKQLTNIHAKIARTLKRISKSKNLQDQYEAYYGLEWDWTE